MNPQVNIKPGTVEGLAEDLMPLHQWENLDGKLPGHQFNGKAFYKLSNLGRSALKTSALHSTCVSQYKAKTAYI
jgi:hypothetical protein